ncbi:MAG: hypothetical protein Kow0065_10930 [Methylomicrobium sp.]
MRAEPPASFTRRPHKIRRPSLLSDRLLAKKQGRNRIYHYDTLIKEGILKSVETGSIDLF